MDEQKWIAWKMQTSKTWTDMEDVLKYTHIDFIDYDHKTLVEYALELNKVIDRSETEFSLKLVHETKELLDRLNDYAIEHFDREELFMEQYNLPEIDQHKREHKRILLMIRNALDDFNNGKTKVSQKLKYQVMDWLIKHINIIDFNYFDIANWSKHLVQASDWDQVKSIVRLTGISKIDEQHQHFTTLAINVMETISKTPTEEIIAKEFEAFKAYALEHFEYETKFMAKYKIKESEKHLEQHRYFIERLDQLPKEISENIDKLDDMKTWILTWWINHINSIDRESFDYKKWAYQLIEEAETLEDVSIVLRRTGIEEIDNDHLHLMEVTLKLNKLITSHIQNGDDLQDSSIKNEILELLRQIYSIAVHHFEREEKIMLSRKMKDYNSHHKEHAAVLSKLKGIEQNYTENRLHISSNIKTIILEWWIQHTNNVDFRTFVLNSKPNADNSIRKEDAQL